MARRVEDALTEGLLAGYAGQSESYQEMRDVFEMNVKHNEGDGYVYHDEWIAGEATGGGQELVRLGDGTMFTRLYAGGLLTEDKLEKLGTDGDKVINFLKESLNKLGDQTRLFGDTEYESDDGSWKYTYAVPEIYGQVIQGEEFIRYRGNVVFIHLFLLAPIK